MEERYKFRVWCKETEEYKYDVTDTDWRTDLYTVEQCTGLKDKNGKLIYEGDILEYQNEQACNGRYPVAPIDPLEGDKFTLDTEWQDLEDKYRFTNVEIISNIHQEDK